MATLKTIYRIRAEIPAQVAEQSGVLLRAREIGLNLKCDDAGNIEGAWDASLLTLAMVLNTLQAAGVQKPLIQRRVVAFFIAAEVSKTGQLTDLLRKFGISEVSQVEDVFSGESVFRCTVPCEKAEQLLKGILEFGESKVIATESYEVIATAPHG